MESTGVITLDATAEEVAPRGDLGGAEELVEHLVSGLSARTQAEYRADLRHLAAASQVSEPEVIRVALGGAAAANRLALAWRQAMLAAGLSPSTVNRRLSALRGALRVARTLGLCSHGIEIRGVRPDAGQMAGPSLASVQAVARYLDRQPGTYAAFRDRALFLGLLFLRGLRTFEALGLLVGDIDGQRINVRRKGRRVKESLGMSASTAAMLALALESHPDRAAPDFASRPVFVGVTGSDRSRPLSRSGAQKRLDAISAEVGIARVRLHGFRHAAITSILDVSGGNVAEAQQFAGHANPKTTMVYDDRRRDRALAASETLAAALIGAGAPPKS